MASTAATTPTAAVVTDPSSIAQYNFGPITTEFVPPTSCLSTLAMKIDSAMATWLYFGHLDAPYVDLSCHPPATVEAAKLVGSSNDNWRTYYYSPAICPFGWSTVTTFASIFEGADPGNYISLGSETTAAVCCPAKYAYNGAGHKCFSSLRQNQVVGYIYPTSLGAQGWDRGSVSSMIFPTGGFVLGDGVPIWWQSSDDALLAAASTITATPLTSPVLSTTTSAAQTSPTAAVPSSTTSFPTATNTPSSTGSPHPGGLSTGAKAGIGVVISLAIIVTLAIGFLLFHRRNRSSDRGVDGAVAQELHSDAKPIYEIGTHPEQYHARHELPETAAHPRRNELE